MVDAAQFRDPDDPTRYGFISESGKLRCGVVDESTVGAGCIAESVIASLPQCSDPASLAPMAHIVGDKVVQECTTQGFYTLAEPVVLRRGTSVKIGDHTFTATADGVTVVASNGHGFLMTTSSITEI